MPRFLGILLLLTISISSYAAPYLFYTQPNTKAGIAFKTKSLKSIVPIYVNDKKWIKVGHKNTGAIGWIKQDRMHLLTQESGQYQRFGSKHSSNKKPLANQTFDYIGPNPITEQEAKAMITRMQQRHAQCSDICSA